MVREKLPNVAEAPFKAAIDIIQEESKLTPKEQWSLAARIYIAMLYFRNARIAAAQPSTLHEIAEPLGRVIDIMKREENEIEVLQMLGAPASGWASPDREAMKLAVNSHTNLLEQLGKILHKLSPPPKPKRGAPAKTRGNGEAVPTMALETLVTWLADAWELWSHKPFKNHWVQDVPATSSCRFVNEVVSFVDPTLVRSLPTITARVVRKRRAGLTMTFLKSPRTPPI